MEQVRKVFAFVIDAIFPPTSEEALARSASYKNLGALLDPRAIERVTDGVALFPYRHPLVRQAIWELKYRGNRRIAALFAQALHDYLLDLVADEQVFDSVPPTLVPIPLARERLRERGFNQVELVLESLPKQGELPVRCDSNLLVRTRETASQTRTTSRREREENLRGAFGLTKGASLPSGAIFLIDDVATTGATLREARAALCAAGARNVRSIALAH